MSKRKFDMAALLAAEKAVENKSATRPPPSGATGAGGGKETKSSAVKLKKEDIKLSAMQQKVVDVVKTKKNIFFTGNAGCGKSFLLEYLIKFVLPEETTFVTAA